MARMQGKPEVLDGEWDEGPPPDDGQGQGDEEQNGTSMALATVRDYAPVQVRTSYTQAIAVQRPRLLLDLKDSSGKITTKGVVSLVCEEAAVCGQDFFYSWTQGKGEKAKLVEGVSIDGAMIMCRQFGNCATEIRVAQESLAHWTFEATFIDIQTGWTFPRLYRQRKNESHQRGDRDRLADIAFQIGQSKALRNVIVSAMPGYLVRRAMHAAKEEALRGYKEQLPAYIEKAKKVYGDLGVSPEQLEAKLGKPQNMWTSEDIRLLIALHRGIMARETSVAQEFAAPEPTPATNGAPAEQVPGSQPKPAAPPALNAEQQRGVDAAAKGEQTAPCRVCGHPMVAADAVDCVGFRFRHPSCAQAAPPTTPAAPPQGTQGTPPPPISAVATAAAQQPAAAEKPAAPPSDAKPASEPRPNSPADVGYAPPPAAAKAAGPATPPAERRRRATPVDADSEPPPGVKTVGDDEPGGKS